jgi:putative membrane protein
MRGILLAAVFGVLIWSGIAPKDRFTWFLEVAPIFIGLPVAVYFDRKYRITSLLFALLCVHACILCVGGKYTYAEVPLGFYVQEMFGFARNHYDRLGHFAQGFVPAIIFREYLIRTKAIASSRLRAVTAISFCLSFSAIYEFIEWFTAVTTGEGATAFLGTQGDVWDTQWDMFMALIGAIAAHALLSRLHDRQISGLSADPLQS